MKAAPTGIPDCDYNDPATGECCREQGPFGYGQPRLITPINVCRDHREWAEAIFREKGNG